MWKLTATTQNETTIEYLSVFFVSHKSGIPTQRPKLPFWLFLLGEGNRILREVFQKEIARKQLNFLIY